MSQPSPTTPAPRRRRRWPYVILAIIILLIILVLLIPTIASTGFVRGYVLGKVNQNLNGKVDIADWSVGWFGGISADGVRLLDNDGRVVLSVKHLETQMTALQAARGEYHLGKTIIDEPDLAHCVVYPDGTTNYQRIFSGQKNEQPTANASATKPEAVPQVEATQPVAEKSARKLPDVDGDIQVKDLKGEIVKELDNAETQAMTMVISPSTAEIKIPSINSPISDDADLNVAVNGGHPGKITASGTIAAIANNEILPSNKITLDQKLHLGNLNLAALSAFMGGIDASGTADGDLALKSQGSDGSANGNITIANFAATGKMLNGDTVKSGKVNVPVDVSLANNVITIKSLKMETDWANLEAAGQFNQDALKNLMDKKAPGSEGNLHLALNVPDAKVLVTQLPHTLNLQQGVEVTSGKIVSALDLTLQPQQAVAKEHLELTDLKGANNGQPVAISNIVNDGSATILPGAELHDLALALQSAFLNVKGGGPTVANLAFDGNFDLAKLKQELGQFIDFSKMQLAGTGTFNLKTQGDLASVIKTQLNAELNNLNYSVPGKPEISQDHLQLAAAGNLDRNKKHFDQANIGVTSSAMNLAMTGDVDYGNKTLPTFDISKAEIPNLAQAEKEFGAFVPSLQKNNVQFASGSLTATLGGSYDGKKLVLSKPLNATLNNVTMSRGNVQVLNNETLNLTAAGTVSEDGGMSADFTNLAVTSSSHLLDLHSRQNAPLMVAYTSTGGFTGKGAVDLDADVKRLTDLGASMGMLSKNEELQSGRLDGSIEFTQAKENEPTQLNGNVTLTQVTVRNYLNNETVKLTFNSSIAPNMHDITGKLGLSSSFANADVTNLSLSGGTLQSADATVNVPDFPKAYALVQSISPTTQPVKNPLQVTRGSMTAKMSIAQKDNSTNLNLSEARITGLQLTRAQNTWTSPSDIDLKAVGSLSQPNKTVKIDQLSGQLGIGQLQMPQPITLTWGNQLSATGAITLTGQLADLNQLMLVLHGSAYPYTGQYSINEAFSTPSAGNIGLKGGATINNFQVVSNGKTTFSEAQLALANDLVMGKSDVAINSLTIDTKSSGALKLSASGTVQDYENKRVIPADKPLKLDLDYDLAKLQPIVKPMLAPNPTDELADLEMSGKEHVTYNVRGSYPATQPSNVAIRSIQADGALAIGKLSTNGITIENLNRPLSLKDGVFTTGTQPATATANGGQMDLSNLTLDFNGAAPTLTTPDNKKLMSGVQVGPIMAAKALKTIPIFGEGANASTLDLTIAQCNKLPVNSAIKKPNDGYAKLLLSVNNVQPGGPLIQAVGQFFSLGQGGGGFNGQIQNAVIEIKNGVINQQTTMTMGGNKTGVLSLNGGINLASMTYQNFTFTLPSSLLTSFDKNLSRYLPAGIDIPVSGAVAHPTVKADQVIAKLTQDAAKNALLGGLTGQQPSNAQPGQNGQPGQNAQPSNGGGIGGLLNQLGQDLGQNKKKKKSK